MKPRRTEPWADLVLRSSQAPPRRLPSLMEGGSWRGLWSQASSALSVATPLPHGVKGHPVGGAKRQELKRGLGPCWTGVQGGGWELCSEPRTWESTWPCSEQVLSLQRLHHAASSPHLYASSVRKLTLCALLGGLFVLH